MPIKEFSADTCAQLLDALTMLVARAAAAIVRVPRNSLAAQLKSDHSPVTAADKAAEAVILEGLHQLLPGISIVSEESTAPASLGETFILVDPLDGTREFLAGRDEYTINIGLIQEGRPAAGLIAAPAQGLIWRGVVGQGAERLRLAADESALNTRGPIPIRTRAMPEHPVAIVSRSHLDPASEGFLSHWQNVTRISCGSALKFCRLAEGAADIYPRLAPTSEWDIAAGHAILVAAGGAVTRPDGTPITYASPGFRIPAFLACGDPEMFHVK
jgi:3'(2'), 5'-bisphosphate nucleotidase